MRRYCDHGTCMAPPVSQVIGTCKEHDPDTILADLIAAVERHCEGMVEPLSERCQALVDALDRAKS